MSPIRRWECSEGPDPFKPNQGANMRTVPGLSSPHRIRPDQMHVYAYGYGKDFAASSVILCCRLKVWAGRSMGAKLDVGFQHFRLWCKSVKKSTSLHDFSSRTFKMGQLLGNPRILAKFFLGNPPKPKNHS